MLQRLFGVWKIVSLISEGLRKLKQVIVISASKGCLCERIKRSKKLFWYIVFFPSFLLIERWFAKLFIESVHFWLEFIVCMVQDSFFWKRDSWYQQSVYVGVRYHFVDCACKSTFKNRAWVWPHFRFISGTLGAKKTPVSPDDSGNFSFFAWQNISIQKRRIF